MQGVRHLPNTMSDKRNQSYELHCLISSQLQHCLGCSRLDNVEDTSNETEDGLV